MIERLWCMGLWAGILIVVVLLFRQGLKKFPKIYSYSLWGLVIFRLLCPIAIESSLSLQPDILHRAEDFVATINATIGQENQVYEEGDFYQTEWLTTMKMQSMEQMEMRPISEERSVTEVEPTTAFSQDAWKVLRGLPVKTLLKIGYLTGVLFFASCFLWQYLVIKKRVAAAIRENGNIWQSEHIFSPFVMGMFFPKIYLPYTIEGDEKRYILRHERTHIRHFDMYTRFLGILACCLHWWNPLVWYAVAKLNEDMEMFCDEDAVAGVSYAERKAYANTLLSFSARQSRLSVVLTFGASHTEKRVKNVLEKKRGSAQLTVLVLFTIMICAFGFLTIPDGTVSGGGPVKSSLSENVCVGDSGDEDVLAENIEHIYDSLTYAYEPAGSNFSYIQVDGMDAYIRSDITEELPVIDVDGTNLYLCETKTGLYAATEAITTETDFYSETTDHLSSQEIELYAQAVRTMILERDWERLSQEIMYPINIKEHIISNAEQFKSSSDLSEEFFTSIQNEDCREMFHNAFGIHMGGDRWVTIKVIYDDKSGKWVPRISGIADKRG